MNDAVLAGLQAVVLSRAAERILLVLVGALSVYLGYTLFRSMPSVNRSEGKIELPGGVSIFLSRIGPGIFFAHFGCAIIGYSVTKPVEFTLPNAASCTRRSHSGSAGVESAKLAIMRPTSTVLASSTRR